MVTNERTIDGDQLKTGSNSICFRARSDDTRFTNTILYINLFLHYRLNVDI